MRATHPLFCAATLLLATAAANADSVMFQSFANTRGANDMSPDGRYIVGSTLDFRAYLLDTATNQMTILIAPANGSVTIATCSSTPAPFHDSTLALFSGTCGKLTEIACGEDECPEFFYSQITGNGLTPGAMYILCVMNPRDWLHSVRGPFVLTATSP